MSVGGRTARGTCGFSALARAHRRPRGSGRTCQDDLLNAGRLRDLLVHRFAGALAGAPTALIIPVPECSVVVTPPSDMPHHVTVIYPFVGRRHVNARLIAGLTEVFGSQPEFDFELTSVGRFPEVLYLSPEPVQPFRRLVEECTRQWPSHPPYGGRFPEFVPHLTLAIGPEPAGLAERVTPRLPIRARATEVWLMERTRSEGWRRVVRLPLADVGSRRAPYSST